MQCTTAAQCVQVGDQFITTSITVLEQKNGPQCIFGLDNMRRHQCCIDLPANALRIGTCSVSLPFLPEHGVPKDFNTSRQLDNEKVRSLASSFAREGFDQTICIDKFGVVV